MRENKSVRNSLIIAAVIIVITASFYIINYVRTDRNEPFVSTNDVINIKEKMFISQVNDVYVNPEDYLGKTIKLEGIFKMEQGYDKLYCFVLRYGPGCCGNDGNVGFEVAWDKEREKPYPGIDSWVEATGELKTYEEDEDYQYLYLDLVSLNVLNKRGMETVMQ
ncbi:MAG: hypothetical protein LBB81_01575 [Treponema sp.]|jgi:uncharacterized membrane protein YcgQ (UPF0703/DUF1980 family)|nr:hypothetical protein [Treponema sp.]